MKVKLISANLNTRHISIKGIVDRRFKTGYRIMPKDYMGYELALHLYNPDNYFRRGQIVWTLNTQFMVIETDSSMSPSMVLRQCMATERGNEFTFTSEIEVLLLRFTVGEGSI